MKDGSVIRSQSLVNTKIPQKTENLSKMVLGAFFGTFCSRCQIPAITQGFQYAWIGLNDSWTSQNIPELAGICMNMLKTAWMTFYVFVPISIVCLLERVVTYFRDLKGRRMGIAANSSVLTQLSLVIKNLKNSRCANLLANRKPYLFFYLLFLLAMFILSQSKANM